MCGRSLLVCCLLQGYVSTDELIASDMTVETVIWKTVRTAAGKSTLQLFYGNNESMQTVGASSALNFHYGETEVCHWACLKLQSFFYISMSPFLPSSRGTLWLLWAGPSL